MRLGYPVLDYAGYHEGQALSLTWKENLDACKADTANDSFGLREYQQEAVQLFQGTEGQGEAVWWCCLVAQERQL